MKRSTLKIVAFQGELGAFSHSAALKLVGESAHVAPFPSFKEVFEALRLEKVGSAVIPIENTLHGSVLENYDNLLQYGFPICGETSVRISHQLIAMPGTRFRDVIQTFSHPVALNQCRLFFEKHKGITAQSFYDTAGSVKMLRDKSPPGAAAIASAAAAEIYGGIILKRNIEDNPRNYTRFFLLTKQSPRVYLGSGKWKTSIVFSAPNTPGSLFRVLACLALRDLSLTKIESRPLIGSPWEYLFYVDFWGSVKDPIVERALSNLAETTVFCKVLGSYRATP